MIKNIIKKLFLWIVFWIWIFISLIVSFKVLAALTNVSSWDTLTATTWNDMISNFFWKNWWSWNIYYTWGNVWIWTTNTTEKLEVNWVIKSTSWWIKFPDNSIQTKAANITCTSPTYAHDSRTWTYGPQCVFRSQCPAWYTNMWCYKTQVITNVGYYSYEAWYITSGYWWWAWTPPAWSTEGCSWWLTFDTLTNAQNYCNNWNYWIHARCCKIN